MPLWWTAYSALIRRPQVFNRRAAWVRSAETGDLRGYAVQKRRSTWVRGAETGDLRGYAVQKQETCIATQSRRRRVAWVRRATKVQVCPHSKSTRRDNVFWCVPAVTVRGAIVSLGASLQ